MDDHEILRWLYENAILEDNSWALPFITLPCDKEGIRAALVKYIEHRMEM